MPERAKQSKSKRPPMPELPRTPRRPAAPARRAPRRGFPPPSSGEEPGAPEPPWVHPNPPAGPVE